MSTATLIMVVLICVGCCLGLAGLIALAYQAVSLIKTARRAGVSSRGHVQEVMGRIQRMTPRFREMEAKQRALAEKFSGFSTKARGSN